MTKYVRGQTWLVKIIFGGKYEGSSGLQQLRKAHRIRDRAVQSLHGDPGKGTWFLVLGCVYGRPPRPLLGPLLLAVKDITVTVVYTPF